MKSMEQTRRSDSTSARLFDTTIKVFISVNSTVQSKLETESISFFFRALRMMRII
jgi:hypothetical protein